MLWSINNGHSVQILILFWVFLYVIFGHIFWLMSFLITLLCSGGFQTLEKEIRSLLIQFNDEYLIYTRLVHYNNVIQLLLVNGYYALFWSWFFFLFLSTGDSDPMPEMMTGPMTGNVNRLRYTLRCLLRFYFTWFLFYCVYCSLFLLFRYQVKSHNIHPCED